VGIEELPVYTAMSQPAHPTQGPSPDAYTESQIAFFLKQAEEGTAIAEVCRKTGISEATFYNWRHKYGGLLPS
jgi:hypothetical protein